MRKYLYRVVIMGADGYCSDFTVIYTTIGEANTFAESFARSIKGGRVASVRRDDINEMYVGA